jgi:hypothetical protein
MRALLVILVVAASGLLTRNACGDPINVDVASLERSDEHEYHYDDLDKHYFDDALRVRAV